MNQTTITINEKLSARLSIYQYNQGLPSWESAIERLLNLAEKQSQFHGSASTGATKPTVAPARFPQIIYRCEQSGTEIGKEEFQRRLLTHKKARVRIHYTDGSVRDKIWHANNITEGSDIRANLATGYLRDWRKKRICKAEIVAMPPPNDLP